MKGFILILSIFISFSSFAAINLDTFQASYDPLSGRPNMCGIRLEVTSSGVVVTNIAPPNKDARKFCSQIDSGCGGESFYLTCDNSGDCVGKTGEVVLKLLKDGNIFFANSGTKFIRSGWNSYSWCTY